jgi:hypothetical protein
VTSTMLLTRIKRVVSRGYGYEVPDLAARTRFFTRSSAGAARADVVEEIERDALAGRYEAELRGGIAVILPTVLARAPLAVHREIVSHIAGQLSDIRRRLPGTPVAFCIGLQYEEGNEAAAVQRLRDTLSAVWAQADTWRHDLVFIGIVAPRLHKVVTLNAAFGVLRRFGLRGIGWTDDDVRFSDGAWARLAEAFLAGGGRGAVGAVKLGLPGDHLAARALYRLKQLTQPATNYPHGCAILVDARQVGRGIPPRYISDDGFVCFENLRPDAADPLEQLRLVAGASCLHYVGGPAGQTLKRLRRMLINHVVFMADYPDDVARTYFRELLFGGLWPLAPFDRSKGGVHGVKKLGVKLVYFGWFSAVCAELFVRGVAGRPLRDVRWNGYAALERP